MMNERMKSERRKVYAVDRSKEDEGIIKVTEKVNGIIVNEDSFDKEDVDHILMDASIRNFDRERRKAATKAATADIKKYTKMFLKYTALYTTETVVSIQLSKAILKLINRRK